MDAGIISIVHTEKSEVESEMVGMVSDSRSLIRKGWGNYIVQCYAQIAKNTLDSYSSGPNAHICMS
jgi:hypothetical protein